MKKVLPILLSMCLVFSMFGMLPTAAFASEAPVGEQSAQGSAQTPDVPGSASAPAPATTPGVATTPAPPVLGAAPVPEAPVPEATETETTDSGTAPALMAPDTAPDTAPEATPGSSLETTPEPTAEALEVLESGLDKHNLADGAYTLSVQMIKAADHASLSMADGAVDRSIYLTVQGGQYYATVGFHGMTINLGYTSFFGYLKTLKYYEPGYSWNNYGTPVGTLANATVLSLQRGEDGTAITDFYNDENNPYPKYLRFPLVNKANYADNDVPLQVFVPIMENISTGNGTQDVLMRLNWDSLVEYGGAVPGFETVPTLPADPADKSALEALIAKAQIIAKADTGMFVAEAFAGFTAILDDAKTVVVNDAATQEAVDDQTQALQGALDQLLNSGLAQKDEEGTARVTVLKTTGEPGSMLASYLTPDVTLERIGGIIYATLTFASGAQSSNVAELNSLNTYVAGNIATRYYGLPLAVDADAKTYIIKLRMVAGDSDDTLLELKMPPMPREQSVMLRLSNVQWQDNSPAVAITDLNLKKAILEAAGISYTNDDEVVAATVTENTMARMTTLDASGRGIINITGIGKAINLTSLNLSGNPLGNALPGGADLPKLTKLKILNLSNCSLAPNYKTAVTAQNAVLNANLRSALVALRDLEEFYCSNNGILGTLSLTASEYPKLRIIDFSNSGVSSVNLSSVLLPSLERFDISGGYYYFNEDSNFFTTIAAIGADKFVYDTDKNLASLYSVFVVKNGYPVGDITGTFQANTYLAATFATHHFTQEGSFELDLGTINSSRVIFGARAFAPDCVVTVVEGQRGTPVFLNSVSKIADSLFTLDGLVPGQNEIALSVEHANGQTLTYNLKIVVSGGVPSPDGVANSAGIKDAVLQDVVCAKLAPAKDPTTYVVTQDDMATLGGPLSLGGVKDLSGIEYATNITGLYLSDLLVTEYPDMSALVKITRMQFGGRNCTVFPDASKLPAKLQRLYVNLPALTQLPSLVSLRDLLALYLGSWSGSKPESEADYMTRLTALPDVPTEKLNSLYLYALPNVTQLPGNIGSCQTTGAMTLFIDGCAISDVSATKTVASQDIKVTFQNQVNTTMPTGIAGNQAISNVTSWTMPDIGESQAAPNLHTLSVSAVNAIPDWLCVSPNITTLYIYSGTITDVPAGVANMTKLETLNIRNCQIQTISTDLSGLTKLKSLNMSYNAFTTWPQALENLGELTSLDLSNNSITDMGLANLSGLSRLTTLTIPNNGMEVLPDIRSLTALTQFNATGNRYHDLPADYFGSLALLRQVQLGSVMKAIPGATAALTEPLPGTGAAQAIASLKANWGGTGVQTIQIWTSYAELKSLDSSFGPVSFDAQGNATLFAPIDTKTITLTPSVWLDDTRVYVNETQISNSQPYELSGLINGENIIAIRTLSSALGVGSVSNASLYIVKVVVGEPLEPGVALQEGRLYVMDYQINKRDTAGPSMADSYFSHKAKVKLVGGSYVVDITTTSAGLIPEMKYQVTENYYDALMGNWTDTLRFGQADNIVSFRLELANLDDTVFLKPYVVPMGYWPVCRLALNTSVVYDITGSVEALDTVALDGAITTAVAQAEKRNIFTTATWDAFQAALSAAQQVLDNAQKNIGTQEAVNQAAADLIAAQEALTIDSSKLANKQALTASILAAQALEKGNHTNVAWNALQDAIAQAVTVRDDNYATQNEVDLILAALNAAVALFNNGGEASQLDKDNLADGSYSVHIDMIKSVDHASKSMADGAVNHTATIVVSEGKYYANLEFVGMTINLGGTDMFGYLQRLKYYDAGYTWNLGEPQGTLIPATVTQIHTNPDGSVLTDYYNDTNNPYPKTLTFPMVNKASYLGNDLPLQVFVPIMETIAAGNGTQSVLMRIDWSTLAAITGGGGEEPKPPEPPKPPTTDKSALSTKISEARAITRADWTDVSWDSLQTAIANAQRVIGDIWATQTEIDQQLGYLGAAIVGLEHRPQQSVDTPTNKDGLADGKYQLRVDLWHATMNRASMGNDALNHTALLEVIGDSYYLNISGHQMQVGNIVASLLYIQIRQANGLYVNAQVTAWNIPGGKPSAFRFLLPSRDTYIAVKVDPQVEAMGNQPVDARLRLSWDTLVRVADNAQLDGFTGIAIGSALGSSQVISAAQSLKDESSGISIEADANIIPDGSKLSVVEISSGEIYERAQNALKNIGSNFVLHSITVTTADGSLVTPAAPVKVSIPVPAGMDKTRVAVYLIKDDGTKTLMECKVEGDLAVFYTNQFGCYALVEKDSAAANNTGAGAQSGGATGTIADDIAPLVASVAADDSTNFYWILIPIAVIAVGAVAFVVQMSLRRKRIVG